MIERLLAVAFGGSIGAVARYLVYYFVERTHQGHFPLATITVNLIGSLLIGFLWGMSDRFYMSSGMRLLVFIGLLGSFTTFSTYSFDVFALWRDGEFRTAVLYVLGSSIGGVLLAFAGYYLSRMF
jgi:CrcB protein